MPRRHSKKSKKKGGNSLNVPQDSPRRSSLRRPGTNRSSRRVRIGSVDSRPPNETPSRRPQKRSSRSSSSLNSSSPSTKSTKTTTKVHR